MMTVVNFVLLYSNFTLSLIASVLSLVTFQTGTYVVYARDLNVGVLVGNIFVLLIWLVLTLGLIHKFTLTVCDQFTELRDAVMDTKRLLHNTTEGVVVLNENHQQAKYYNWAANQLEIFKEKSIRSIEAK